jgi:NAD(P) transhydrogenase subunit alpha
MQVVVIREHSSTERRVALTPREVAKLVAAGVAVLIESAAGERAGYPDDLYAETGATVLDQRSGEDGLSGEDTVVTTVGFPSIDQIRRLDPTSVVIGMQAPPDGDPVVDAMMAAGVESYAFDRVPRTTRAQSMDALSSQATAAGYSAVLLGAHLSPRLFPMLTTAAGTVPPASVLVLGAGVAGLQAIATARRLGAVVTAYDVRPEVEEQILSLGAKFIEAPQVATASESGYAHVLSEDTSRAQLEALTPHVAAADVVITTAQVPRTTAPILINEPMVAEMGAGAVIVDMAASTGGNCALTRADEEVEVAGVRIVGPTNLASNVAYDASRMYSRNVEALLGLLIDGDKLRPDRDDEILQRARVTPAESED